MLATCFKVTFSPMQRSGNLDARRPREVSMLSAFARFERALCREGAGARKPLANGQSINAIAKKLKIGVATVDRLKQRTSQAA